MHRRPFIEALCTAAAVGTIAGCLDDGGGDGGNGNGGDDGNDTDPGNGGENDTDEANGNGSDDDGNGTDEEDGDTVDGGENGSDEGDENDTDDGNGTDGDDGNDTGEGDGNGTDGDDGGDGDAPEVTIETVGTDCAGGGSEGDGNAAVEEGDVGGSGDRGVDEATIEATGEGAAVRGRIGSPTPCYEARVTEETVADGELRLRIGVEEDDSDLCMECVGAVEYEATMAGTVDRIVVEHERFEEDPTEVAEADLED